MAAYLAARLDALARSVRGCREQYILCPGRKGLALGLGFFFEEMLLVGCELEVDGDEGFHCGLVSWQVSLADQHGSPSLARCCAYEVLPGEEEG